MNTIPTAEELFYKYSGGEIVMIEDEAQNYAIEFAKLHVEAALKVSGDIGYKMGVDARSTEQQILNAYPLTNIK